MVLPDVPGDQVRPDLTDWQWDGLPYALNQAGLPLGLMLLVAVAFITDYSIILLIKGSNLSGTNSYQSLVQSTFGFPGFVILSGLQFLYPFIAMVSYNITTGDTLTKVFQRIPGAFVCHHNSFLIYGSLEQPTLANWSRITHMSVGSALIISAAFAVSGYTTFTGYTQGDVFENYCRNDNLATFGRFCFGFSIITTFPLECFVTREVLSNAIFRRDLSKVEHVAITVVIGVLSATPLIFIIPAACFLKLSPGRWFQGENLIPTILIVVGFFVMITGLTMTALYPQTCSHGVEMFYCADANVSVTAPPV
ncbi:hypothetical protein F7725_001912 [Dissostichus mawsoni]|uniref:Putative sodium-coupled neutral amino acid transporter 11 n=1 Tax=Dissostichus mawsoni TaxID=36200 RepID=A0A7J5Y1V4_DISMA|nr:hypothetical protein F7725_001912 [Dissostichus mawsoni]